MTVGWVKSEGVVDKAFLNGGIWIQEEVMKYRAVIVRNHRTVGSLVGRIGRSWHNERRGIVRNGYFLNVGM